MKNNIAPIVIFSFNRPKKIKKLFKSLKKIDYQNFQKYIFFKTILGLKKIRKAYYKIFDFLTLLKDLKK